jgi:hypothetical protein
MNPAPKQKSSGVRRPPADADADGHDAVPLAGLLQLPIGAPRTRRGSAEGAADERWLRWIAQHRYVDARALEVRFGVTLRAVWRRVGRLADARLLVRRGAGQLSIFYLSSRAERLLDVPRRKPPTAPLAALNHDLAVARWHARLTRAIEENTSGAEVLTERGLRERHTSAKPYCAFVRGEGGRMVKRWPDVALERSQGLYAYELEFTAKSHRRLQAIVRAYRNEARFQKVTYLVTSAALGRRLVLLAMHEQAATITVEPWYDLAEPAQQAIRDTVSALTSTLPSPVT